MQIALSPRRRLGTFRLGEIVAHQIPTGFWDVWQPVVTQLTQEFSQMWDGEANNQYRGCDRVLFGYIQGGSSGFWGHGEDNPPIPTVPPDPPVWWNDGPSADRTDAWRNANAWVGIDEDSPPPDIDVKRRCALFELARMNVVDPKQDPSETNPSTRTMRGVISRELHGLAWQRVNGVLVENWSEQKIRHYAGRICDRLVENTALSRNLENACLGWWVKDDTFPKAVAEATQTDDLDKMKKVLRWVHEEQDARELNLPFFINFNIDFTWSQSPLGCWRVFPVPQPDLPGPPRYQYYEVQEWMKKTFRRVSDGGCVPDDAVPIAMPYFFPWNSGKWENYGTLPPWLMWKEAIYALDKELPYERRNEQGQIIDENRRLQFQSILEFGKYQVNDLRAPGHADMHKQIRVLLDMEPDSRITGMWFATWTVDQEADPWVSVGKDDWLVGRQWAEAVQTEIGDEITQPSTELIGDARPSSTRLVAVGPSSIQYQVGHARIYYELASAGGVRFVVEHEVTPNTWVAIKVIDEGFRGISPTGYYTMLPSTPTDDPLRGTSANWDGYRDDTESSSRPPAEPGTYRVRMFVNDIEVPGSPQMVTVV